MANPPDDAINAALLTPTCSHLTTTSGTMYATERVYDAMVEQANKNNQTISCMLVAAIYDLNDGWVYVQIDKPSSDPKDKKPVRVLKISQLQVDTVSTMFDHQIMAACASLSRLHYKAWEEKLRQLVVDDEEDEEFEITPEDLDDVPVEELQAALARRKR